MKFNTKLLSFLSLGLLLVSCLDDTNNKIYFGLDSNKFDALIGVKDKEVSSNNDKGTSYYITYGINHIYGYFNSYLYNNVTVYDVTYNSNDEFPRPSYEDYEVVSFFDDEISFITSANVNPLPKVNADGLTLSLIEAVGEGILTKEDIKQINNLFNIYYQDYIDEYLLDNIKTPTSKDNILNYGFISRPNLDDIISIYDNEFNVKKEDTLFINYYGTYNSYLLVELCNNEYISSFNDLELNNEVASKYKVSNFSFAFNDEYREIYGYNIENNDILSLKELYDAHIINSFDLLLINSIHKTFYNY